MENLKIKKILKLIFNFILYILLLCINIINTFIIRNKYQILDLEKNKINLNCNFLFSFLFITLIISSILLIMFIFYDTDIISLEKKNIVKAINIIFLIIILSLIGFYLIYLPIKRNKTLQYMLIISFLSYLSIYLYMCFDYNKVRNNISIKMMIEGTIAIAFCVLLSFMSDQFMPKFPKVMGGIRFSITMFPIFLVSIRNNFIIGLITGFIYSIFNMLLDGAIYHIGSIFLDYIIPFTLLGLSGIGNKYCKRNLKKSVFYIFILTFIPSILRYLLSSISGVIFFKEYAPEGVNYVLYSFVFVNLPNVLLNYIASFIMLISIHKFLIDENKKVV